VVPPEGLAHGIAPKADTLMPAGSYLVLLWLLEQVRFAVNKDIISFEEHVTRGWRASDSNGTILSVEISRRFVRRSIHVDFSSITSLEKQKHTTFIAQRPLESYNFRARAFYVPSVPK
jgi:hypothetical protein